MVGMPRTPYLVGTCGFSSMFSLAMVTLSPNSVDSSSSAGAIMRQGPHHSAQKSTSTGFLASRTSAWKEASDTLMGMMMIPELALPYLGTHLCWVKTRCNIGQTGVQNHIGKL